MQNEIQNVFNFISDIYELTPMQEGILYHTLLEGKTSKYIIQNIFIIKKIIIEKYIQDTLELLSYRHDVLKTSVMYEKSERPLQVLLKNRKIEYSQVNLNKLCGDSIKILAKEEIERGFDLQRDSLVRIIFVNYDNIYTKVIWTMHHIIIDGWCLPLLLGDFMRFYEMLLNGKDKKTIEKVIDYEKRYIGRYCEYITWLENQDKLTALDYWRKELENYTGIADIKSIQQSGSVDATVCVKEFQIKKNTTEKLQEYTKKNEITMNIIVETTWGIVLQWYNGVDDVVFGKVVSGRHADIHGIDKIVGLFINTIPCRIKNLRGMTVAGLLKQIQRKSIESINYSYISLADIQDKTEQRRDLIKTLFAYENYYISEESKKNLMPLEIVNMREETNYDMNITAFMSKDHLCMRLTYNPQKYSNIDVDLLSKRIIRILDQIADQPNILVQDLEITTEAEQKLILGKFNDTNKNYPKNQTVVELFEEQVERTPDSLVLLYNVQNLTYHEFNSKVNQLAHRLRELGIRPNDFVAILAERSLEMIIGIYGIIKAGGAYVPIDPTYPKDRIDFIITDCNPKVLLLYQVKLETEIPVINLADSNIFTGDSTNLERINKPKDLVYCIYTSGTTGYPKGVLIENKALINYLHYARNNYIDKKIDIPFFVNYSFDFSCTSLFLAILYGGRLHILSKESNFDSNSLLANVNYSLVKLTPSLLESYIGTKKKGTETVPLTLIVGGENFKRSIANNIFDSYGCSIKIHNEYGPTEATIGCCDYVYSQTDKGLYLLIGRPISNTQIYIMNGNRLCGIGIIGELCIGGDGLARGYLNQPELTANKFVKNPFGNGRIYRSGDMARWTVDGNLEYIGRMDDQVKIRGFRVELGEVEYRLCEIKGIQKSVVLAHEDGNGEKAIYAYVISNNNICANEIKEMLSRTLPTYMIPTYLFQISNLPLTLNGKLDKMALLKIKKNNKKEYVKPQNEVERTLYHIFKKILGIEHISVNDSFFDLGGHSLRAIKLELELQKFYKDITIRDIYEYSTIERLAQYINWRENKI